MVGVSLIALTLSTKESERVDLPSETVIVTVEVPDLFDTGFIITVRLDPDPPKEMLPTGSKAELLDVRVKLNELLEDSISFTVKLTVLVISSLLL